MAKLARRGRDRHPGVVLIKPDPAKRMGWRARWKDPDSGKAVRKAIPPERSETDKQRATWALEKSRELARRRAELAMGAVRATGTTLEVAINRYYSDKKAERRARTLEINHKGTDKLLDWAKREGIKSADDLTRPKLLAFRSELIATPRRHAVKGGKRGERSLSEEVERRAPQTVNQELRGVLTVLRYLAELDLLPRLNERDLRIALKRLEVISERPEYLRPHECRALLEAALRHDADTFKITRAEHDEGTHAHGKTARYDPVAPFVACVLLTGMRFGEAATLDWGQVDFEVLDNAGSKIGEIHLEGTGTKTRRGREVSFEVSPALRSMLAAMHLATGGEGRVFPCTADELQAAAKRLRGKYGAPRAFTWQMLRRTCGTYLTNAPGIFGSASAFRSAAQLGHSVAVAEKAYLGLVKGIPRDAHTLEAAMQIEAEMDLLVARMTAPPASNVVNLQVMR